MNAFVVDVKLRSEKGGKVIEVFIDTDNGVTTDVCANMSRELSRALDLENILQGRYHLVVSSPGIDRPLKFTRQYRQHAGRTLSVKYATDGEVHTIEGELVQATPDGIELRSREKSLTSLSFNDIIEARVKAAW